MGACRHARLFRKCFDQAQAAALMFLAVDPDRNRPEDWKRCHQLFGRPPPQQLAEPSAGAAALRAPMQRAYSQRRPSREGGGRRPGGGAGVGGVKEGSWGEREKRSIGDNTSHTQIPFSHFRLFAAQTRSPTTPRCILLRGDFALSLDTTEGPPLCEEKGGERLSAVLSAFLVAMT